MSILNTKPELSKDAVLESYGFVQQAPWAIWVRRIPHYAVKITVDSTGWAVSLYGVYDCIISTRYYLSFFEAVKLAEEWVESHKESN